MENLGTNVSFKALCLILMFAIFYSNFEFSTGSVLTLKGYLVNQMVNMKGVARFILINGNHGELTMFLSVFCTFTCELIMRIILNGIKIMIF